MGTIGKYMSMALGMAALASSVADTNYTRGGTVRSRHSIYIKSELAAIKKRRKKNKNKKTHRK